MSRFNFIATDVHPTNGSNRGASWYVFNVIKGQYCGETFPEVFATREQAQRHADKLSHPCMSNQGEDECPSCGALIPLSELDAHTMACAEPLHSQVCSCEAHDAESPDIW